METRLFEMNLFLFDRDAVGNAAPVNNAVLSSDGQRGDGKFSSRKSGRTADGKDTNQQNNSSDDTQEYTNIVFDSEKQQRKGEDMTDKDRYAARRNEFEKLVRAEYRDVFAEHMQSLIDTRAKETNRLSEISPLIDVMMRKYGVDDISKLSDALNEDTTYWEDAANQAGITVEQYQFMRKLGNQTSEHRKAEESAKKQEFVRGKVDSWIKQAYELSMAYPKADFSTELSDARFLAMIRSDVPIKHAYEVLHIDNIKDNLAHRTAKMVERNVVHNIRAKGNRPIENGTSTPGGVIIKSNVGRLSKLERAEIARRVQRGENINF